MEWPQIPAIEFGRCAAFERKSSPFAKDAKDGPSSWDGGVTKSEERSLATFGMTGVLGGGLEARRWWAPVAEKRECGIRCDRRGDLRDAEIASDIHLAAHLRLIPYVLLVYVRMMAT